MNQLTCVFFGLFFFIFGLLFYMGKLHSRFAVWKNMNAKEKEKIRILPLCKNIGQVIMLAGVIFMAKGTFAGFSNTLFVILMVGWLLLSGIDVLYIGKSKRYINNNS